MLLVSIGILAPNTAKEFGPAHSTLISAPLYAGLLVGAIAYGVLADKVGRKLIWQASIYGVSIVNMLSASATSWTAMNVCVDGALMGFLQVEIVSDISPTYIQKEMKRQY